MQDGSNGYPEPESNGIYESKDAIRYPILLDANDKGDKQYALGWYFPKSGGRILPHSHPFKHYSYLVRGSIVVTGDAEGRNNVTLVAPDIVRFESGVTHSLTAVKDDTYLVHFYPINVMGDEG